MKDRGFPKGLLRDFDTNDKTKVGALDGLRKIFWSYLRKLNVPFYDICCEESRRSDRLPVAYDESQGQLVRYNPATKTWDAVLAFTATTTTTTTAAPTTTTTTTAAP